jgi:hypothetical protein
MGPVLHSVWLPWAAVERTRERAARTVTLENILGERERRFGNVSVSEGGCLTEDWE